MLNRQFEKEIGERKKPILFENGDSSCRFLPFVIGHKLKLKTIIVPLSY